MKLFCRPCITTEGLNRLFNYNFVSNCIDSLVKIWKGDFHHFIFKKYCRNRRNITP